MKYFLILLLVVVVTTASSLWPLPAKFQKGQQKLTIYDTTKFQFKIENSSDDLLNAVEFYKSIIFPQKTISKELNSLLGIHIIVVDPIAHPLKPNTDESYQLNVPLQGWIILKANTYVGCLRGLETFSQLILKNGEIYTIESCPWDIEDKPRFNYRGISLDTARHYYPVKDILRLLDGMMFSKLNVFHWHITDSQRYMNF